MELAKIPAKDDFGFGSTDPSETMRKERAAKSWEEFRTLARFSVGGEARIGGKRITIEELRPITGGYVHVKGYGIGYTVDGQYKPSDLDVV